MNQNHSPVRPAFSHSEKVRVVPCLRKLVFPFILLAAVVAAYQPALRGGMLWDDDAHITRSKLRSLHGLGRIWTSPGATQQYYPVVHTAFWLQHRLWGDATRGYHLVTVFLHLLTALLLLNVLRSLKVPGAGLAAALFALHPVQVESVAWITELKNTLSGIFFFGAALVYLKFDKDRRKDHYAAALALFVLGLLSKSVIATLPLSLLAIFWWKRGNVRWKRDVIPLLPFFGLGILSGLFTAWMERSAYGAQGAEFDFTVIERCLIAGRAVWFYLGKIFLPVNLMFIYPRWEVSQAVWWQYLFPTAALGLAAFLWTLRKRSRAFFAALVCFAAALFPVLGFFNVYPFKFSFVADHFQYLACASPLALAGAVLWQGIDRIRGTGQWFLKTALCGLLLLPLGAATRYQCRNYTDVETLYRSIIRKNSACWMAHTNLGIMLANSGKNDEAMHHCRRAMEIDSTKAECHNNLGLLLAITGDVDGAIARYRKAISINPRDAEALNNLGNALFQTGDIDAAADSYRKTVAINPYHAGALNNLGNISLHYGQAEEAIAQYRKVLAVDPDYVEVHNNLGMALARTGRDADALVHYRKALALNPDYVMAHYNIGILMSETGLMDSAVAHYWTAFNLNPDDLRAVNTRCRTLMEKKREGDAISFMRGIHDLAKHAGNEQAAASASLNIESIRKQSAQHGTASAGRPPE
jgi:tetratricopeptide (TPR) repeat protein